TAACLTRDNAGDRRPTAARASGGWRPARAIDQAGRELLNNVASGWRVAGGDRRRAGPGVYGRYMRIPGTAGAVRRTRSSLSEVPKGWPSPILRRSPARAPTAMLSFGAMTATFLFHDYE